MSTASTIVTAALVRQLRDARRQLWDLYRAFNAAKPNYLGYAGGKAERDALNEFSWLIRGIMSMEQKDGSYDSAADALYAELVELDKLDRHWDPVLDANRNIPRPPWDVTKVFDFAFADREGNIHDLCDYVTPILLAFSGRPAHRHPGHAGLN
jgi:hypothetical protein